MDVGTSLFEKLEWEVEYMEDRSLSLTFPDRRH